MAYQTRRKKPKKKRNPKKKTIKKPKGGIRPGFILTSFMYLLKNNNKIKHNYKVLSQNPPDKSPYPQGNLPKGPELYAAPFSVKFDYPPTFDKQNKTNTRTNKHKKQNKTNTRTNKHKKQK